MSSAPPPQSPVAATFSPRALAGRRALVVGGTTGLGLAIARALRECGATVAVASSNPANVAAAAPLVDLAVVMDVTSDASVRAALEGVGARFGGALDVLVNAAGVLNRAPAAAEAPGDFSRVLNVNLTGAFRVATGAFPLLAAARGCIVNVTSLTGHLAYSGTTSYAASKAGLAAMTRSLASEWAAAGIRVNSIAPGNCVTAMNAEGLLTTARGAWKLAHTPAGRFGCGADVAGAAVFLACDAAAYVSGAELVVDGGFSIRGVGPELPNDGPAFASGGLAQRDAAGGVKAAAGAGQSDGAQLGQPVQPSGGAGGGDGGGGYAPFTAAAGAGTPSI